MTRHLQGESDLRAFLDDHPEIDSAVWDFDGAIVDSEPAQAAAYREILGRYGHLPEPEFFEALAGRTEAEIWEVLTQRYALEPSPADLRDARLSVVIERIVATPPNWFVAPLLDALDAHGVNSRIVSSGNAPVIARYLAVQGLSGRFLDVSASPPEAERSGKAGRIARVLKAAKRPLLVEDSAQYLALARSLGAVTIGVRHSINAGLQLDADAIVHGGSRP